MISPADEYLFRGDDGTLDRDSVAEYIRVCYEGPRI